MSEIGFLARHWSLGRRWALAKALGSALLVLAINPWTVARFGASDGLLDARTVRILAALDGVLLFAAGLFAWLARAWLPYSPRKERWLIGSLLAFASVLLMPLVLEVSLHAMAAWSASPQAADRHYFCQLDPEFGWRNRPGASCLFKQHLVAINELGLRDRTTQSTADASQNGLLVLGDSQAFGDGVAYEDTFAARLGQALDVPASNAAVIGYGADQAVLSFPQLNRDLSPRLTLLTMNAYDLRDHLAREIKGGYRKPRFAFDGDELRLERDHLEQGNPVRRAQQWLTQHSRLYGLATHRRRPRAADESETRRWDEAAEVFPADLDAALAVTRSLIARMDAEAGGASSWALVWLPYQMDYEGDAAYADLSQRVRTALAKFCREQRVAMHDLTDDLSTENPADLFLDKLHFSPTGHERVAQALAARFATPRRLAAQPPAEPNAERQP